MRQLHRAQQLLCLSILAHRIVTAVPRSSALTHLSVALIVDRYLGAQDWRPRELRLRPEGVRISPGAMARGRRTGAVPDPPAAGSSQTHTGASSDGDVSGDVNGGVTRVAGSGPTWTHTS